MTYKSIFVYSPSLLITFNLLLFKAATLTRIGLKIYCIRLPPSNSILRYSNNEKQDYEKNATESGAAETRTDGNKSGGI